MRRTNRPRVDVFHGTWTKYARDLCKCVECQAVSRAHGSGTDHQTGDLLVQCWCGVDQVVAPKRDVFEGRTRSCGRDYCEERVA